MPTAESNCPVILVYTFSYSRGTLGSTVGRTFGSASAVAYGSERNAIVYPS